MSNPSLRAGEISLKDAVCFIVDNRGKTVPVQDEGIPLISTACISNEMLFPLVNTDRYVSDEIYENWFRSHPEPGDVILTNKGSKNGEVCLVPDPVSFCIAQDMVALRANRDLVDPGYLLAALRSRIVQERIKSLNVDSVIPHFKKTDFDKLFIPLPSRSEQQFIGGLYLDFSWRIELNRKTNETLEAMAKAHFKSWFVDFDPVRAKAEGRSTGLPAEISDLFPDSFEDSELGEIPSGWEIGRLEEILEIDPQRQLRRGSISPYLEMKGVPTSGHSAVDVITREFSSGSKFRNGDTLLARITPCLENGKTAFVDFLKNGETGWGSTEFIVMCGRREEVNPFAYYLARSEVFRNNAIQNMVGSSGRQRVPSDAVSGFTLPLPPEEILVKFGLLATDLMRRISATADQSVILSRIRDALLPKLISGEIRIPDAEKMLEEVGV